MSPRPTTDVLPERFFRLRNERGLTQRDAADAVGVDARQWQRWESGETTPYRATLEKVSKAFGVTPDYFTGKMAMPSAAEVVGQVARSLREALERAKGDDASVLDRVTKRLGHDIFDEWKEALCARAAPDAFVSLELVQVSVALDLIAAILGDGDALPVHPAAFSAFAEALGSDLLPGEAVSLEFGRTRDGGVYYLRARAVDTASREEFRVAPDILGALHHDIAWRLLELRAREIRREWVVAAGEVAYLERRLAKGPPEPPISPDPETVFSADEWETIIKRSLAEKREAQERAEASLAALETGMRSLVHSAAPVELDDDPRTELLSGLEERAGGGVDVDKQLLVWRLDRRGRRVRDAERLLARSHAESDMTSLARALARFDEAVEEAGGREIALAAIESLGDAGSRADLLRLLEERAGASRPTGRRAERRSASTPGRGRRRGAA